MGCNKLRMFSVYSALDEQHTEEITRIVENACKMLNTRIRGLVLIDYSFLVSNLEQGKSELEVQGYRFPANFFIPSPGMVSALASRDGHIFYCADAPVETKHRIDERVVSLELLNLRYDELGITSQFKRLIRDKVPLHYQKLCDFCVEFCLDVNSEGHLVSVFGNKHKHDLNSRAEEFISNVSTNLNQITAVESERKTYAILSVVHYILSSGKTKTELMPIIKALLKPDEREGMLKVEKMYSQAFKTGRKRRQLSLPELEKLIDVSLAFVSR